MIFVATTGVRVPAGMNAPLICINPPAGAIGQS
jgi:hypothetical protein